MAVNGYKFPSSAYTATQPDVLVYVPKNEKKDKGYCIGEDDEDKEEAKSSSSLKLTILYLTPSYL
jgi:hypothetical protein